jgi:hypothetical protein
VLTDSETITITVNEVNTVPTLDPVTGQTTTENRLLSFTVVATDTDIPANTLTFSLAGPPAGATINPTTGLFAWTPTEPQGLQTYTLTVIATDDGSPVLSTTTPLTITVNVEITATLDSAGGTISHIRQGLTSTIDIPAGALDQPTTFTYTLIPSPSQPLPSSFSFAGRAFTLEASRGGVPVANPFSGPITITLHYSPSAGLLADQLRIYYYRDTSSPGWFDAATTCNPESSYGYGNHFVQVAICHLTEFALLLLNGDGSGDVYLPLILKG